MPNQVRELADALQEALTTKLITEGTMKSDETISIKAIITGKDKKTHRNILVDNGLGIFKVSGNRFYDRELTPEELDNIQKLSFADEWQQAVVSEILKNKNTPISEDTLPEIALTRGYRIGAGRFEEKATLWPTKILSGINRSLKITSQSFRLFIAEKRRVNKSYPTRFYRFYRMIEETLEDIPQKTAE